MTLNWRYTTSYETASIFLFTDHHLMSNSNYQASCSSLCPCLCRWFDNSLLTNFRGSQHLDGGLTNFIPVPPDSKAGIRVCCFPSKQLSPVYNIQISPDNFEDWPYTLREVGLLSAFLPLWWRRCDCNLLPISAQAHFSKYQFADIRLDTSI